MLPLQALHLRREPLRQCLNRITLGFLHELPLRRQDFLDRLDEVELRLQVEPQVLADPVPEVVQ
jgi:hypothetical protein